MNRDEKQEEEGAGEGENSKSSLYGLVPSHESIRARAHETYVSQAERMEQQYNKKADCLGTFMVGQYVSVPIEMGDHPNRYPTLGESLWK